MTYDELWRPLTAIYDAGEAKAVVRLLLETAFGLSLADVLCGGVERLPATDQQRLRQLHRRLTAGEPVQYVLGEAEFCGRRLAVERGVLIPRPETAELCRWVVADVRADGPVAPALLDVGTGSGCIAVTLAAELAGARVTAWDISPTALDVARRNARRAGVALSVQQQDALQAPPDAALWDVVVSNPPYICPAERADMAPNVLDYEPHEALFAPADRLTLFYEAIGRYARRALKPGGRLFFELNPLLAADVARCLAQLGFAATELRSDQFGRQRFLKATCP